MIEMRAIVHGKVHGVGFRATTLRIARELNLKGRVNNRSDGTVGIIAQGERVAVEELISKLKGLFNIDRFDIQYVKPVKNYTDFSIL